MEATASGSGTTTEQGQPAGTAPAAPPSPSASQAAGAANTAPAANPAREAYERLAKGERPETVNRELYQKPKSSTTQSPSSAPKPNRDAAAPTQASQPQSQDGQPADPAEPTSEKDLQVLRRAKFDMAAWKHIPPSNRQAILKTLRTSQAEMDRQFQQQRAAAGKGTQAATQQQEQPPPQEEATLATNGEEAGDGQQQLEEQEQQQGKPTRQTQQAAPANPFEIDPSQFVDPKDLQTLEAIGGKDLADIHSRGVARVAQALQQQYGQLLPVLEHLLSAENSRQLQQGVDRLAKTPGMEALASDPALQQKLEQKAQRLLRAAEGDPGYSFQDALDDAAAGLFKTNAHAIAQARLTSSRSTSLRGQPDRGPSARGEARPTTAKERNAAIFAKLQEGLSPDEARRAVDGR